MFGRIAVIGARGHYQRVLAEFSQIPSLQIVGVCDGGTDAEPVRQWCHEHGHKPALFEDYRQMLDKCGADICFVCGPFEQHASMCADAIERGIHVLTEKPAAIEMEQLARLRQTCRKHPHVHLAGLMFSRYDPGFYTAWRIISEGAIGRVRLINARKSYKLGRRDSFYHARDTYGGTIPWVGSHAIDWVMWYAQKRFLSVYASQSSRENHRNGTMETSALCQFELEDEIFASVSIDVLRPANAPTHGDDWIRIVGSEGIIEARPNSVKLINAHHDGTHSQEVSCDRTLVNDFLDHVEKRGTTLIDAQTTLDLTDACLRARASADESRLVEFT